MPLRIKNSKTAIMKKLVFFQALLIAVVMLVSCSSTGSADCDSMLDSYEQYVNKYIALLKKAAEGDMTALAEYPALMEKAQEFSEKMENAQGDMSASQWARYMKITTKMTKAAQEMR